MAENKDNGENFKKAPKFPKSRKRKQEEIEILAKARLKKRRPEIAKKRVFVPAVTARLKE